MAQELTFNISEDRRKLQGPVEAKNFNLKFGTDGVAITHGNPNQWVQGRIGDDQLKQVFVNITEGEGNTPKDVAGMFLAFVGIIHDKDGRPHRVVDYKHSTTIDVEHGRFRFDFPDQAFTVAGEYQQAFFMLIKEGPGGGCVATMEFDMQVMANFVFTDLVPEDYITPFNDTVDQLLAACKKFKEDTAADEAKFKQELDDAYAKFQKDTNTQLNNFKDATDEDLANFKKANADDIAKFKQQYADAVQAKEDELQSKVDSYTDKLDTMLKDLNQQGIDTTTMLNDLRSQMAALQDKINSEHLFTEDEADTFKKSIQKLIDAQGEDFKTLTDKVNSNELLLSGYNVRDFGAVGDGETDDTVAIQKAITQVALDWKKDNFKTNLVVMPAGRYKVTNSIVLPPYVKLVSAGLVTIESYLTDGATIQIKWLGDDDPYITGKGLGNAYQLQDWQRGYIIEGSRGGFSLVSKAKSDQSIGIEIGFESDKERGDSNLKNVARSGLNNISIGNYGIGMRLNGIDLFVFNFVNMHIEDNKIDVQVAFVDGGGNYGENIYFDRCVIAGADIGVDQASGGYDMVFNECSLGLNKLAISNSDYSNNNITILGGNLEGNTVIYDASKGSIYWMTSLNIISSNMYIRPDKADSLTMFKGPLILNLDNPYIISTLELDHPEYLCDDKVFVTYNRNPSFARTTSNPIFITERDNILLNGNDMSKLACETDNGFSKVITKDSGLSQQMQDAGFTSAYAYIRDTKEQKNWDNIRPNQRINVAGKSTFLLTLFGLAHIDPGNILFRISFYDQNDKVLDTQTFYAGVAKDVDKVLYGHTPPQMIPAGAVNAGLEFSASCVTDKAKFELGYLGMEVE